MNNSKPSILLIDDNKKNLDNLVERLRGLVPDAELNSWRPAEQDGQPVDVFNDKVDEHTALVITDYDLTTQVKGFFGQSVVGWCQTRAIPVGEYSRANIIKLPTEPSLFELRVPNDEEKAAKYIARAFSGFLAIRRGIEEKPELLSKGQRLASVLSSLLSCPHLESQFAAYMSRPGAANSALTQQLIDYARDEATPSIKRIERKVRIVTYVLGHVLLNSILKYPGPILSYRVLCAYLTTTPGSEGDISGLFKDAAYSGPFSDNRQLFWRHIVDDTIDRLSEQVNAGQAESFGDFNRRIVEAALECKLAPHNCNRCGGEKGGYWCPFTMRPVCERADCSVPASSWIPSGAHLSRVERDFHDEWAPLLGL